MGKTGAQHVLQLFLSRYVYSMDICARKGPRNTRNSVTYVPEINWCVDLLECSDGRSPIDSEG